MHKGVSKFYIQVTEDNVLVNELKRDVFTYIDKRGMKQAAVICQELDIHKMFISEVEDFIEEYRAYEALRVAGVRIKSPNDVKRVVLINEY